MDFFRRGHYGGGRLSRRGIGIPFLARTRLIGKCYLPIFDAFINRRASNRGRPGHYAGNDRDRHGHCKCVTVHPLSAKSLTYNRQSATQVRRGR